MAQFGLRIAIDEKQVTTWQDRFEREVPAAIARANKFVLDEIATDAVTSFRKPAHKHIKSVNSNRTDSDIRIVWEDRPVVIRMLPFHPHELYAVSPSATSS